MEELKPLLEWMYSEIESGNRVKASKIYKTYRKLGRLKYPYITEKQLDSWMAKDLPPNVRSMV